MTRPAALRRDDETAQEMFIAVLLRGSWRSLPALFLGSAGVSAAAIALSYIAPGVNPISAVLSGAVVAPLFGGLIAQFAAISAGEELTMFDYFRRLRVVWRAALALGTIAGCSGALYLIALEVWAQTHDVLAVPPVVAAGIVTVAAAVVFLVGLPLRMANEDLRGIALVAESLHRSARHPVPVVGALSVVVIALVASLTVTASIMLLLAGPLAFVAVAAAHTIRNERPPAGA